MYDVAIVGLGPAGRALADRCAGLGLSVLAVDPDPDRVWRPTYALWTDQIPTWLGGEPSVVAAVARPVLRATAERGIDREYAVLDNAALHRRMPLGRAGVHVRAERLGRREIRGLRSVARRVVDCRGADPERQAPDDHPLQTAYGVVVPSAAADPVLRGAESVFMDWTCPPEGWDDGLGASFLYAVPLGDDRVLLEETCLAGAPAPAPDVLAGRLRRRLATSGASAESVDDPLEVEVVRIPLVPVPGSRIRGVERFGAGGGHAHPATGYSVAGSLGAAPGVAATLAQGRPLPRPRPVLSGLLHRAGLRALLRAAPETTVALMDAFARVPARRQRGFLDPAMPSYEVAGAMLAMALAMPPSARVDLARAVASPGR